MKKFYLHAVLLLLISLKVQSQEITETNTDIIYEVALEKYKNQDYQTSLAYTQKGLELAPEYHDIRVLEVRNYWALENFSAADADLDFLLQNAPEYIDVKPLALQRIHKFEEPHQSLEYIQKIESIYPDDLGLQVTKVQSLLDNNQRSEARNLALEIISRDGVSGADRYVLLTVLNRTVSDEIGINYQYINFSDDYSRNDPWHSISAEYQHNFNRTAVIGRINYSDRSYDEGTLYELEAYPVFSDRFYAYTNIGISDGSVFPDVRTSLSAFYNFAKIYELEAGGRLLHYNNNSYFTGIIGLTAYVGDFFLNARSFVGPERVGSLVQNYQANVRYYMMNADNYLFVRVGSGISPDERTVFTLVQERPRLDAYYGNAGINKSIGVHHIFQLSAGVLVEDITSDKKGNQFIGTVSYRYRF